MNNKTKTFMCMICVALMFWGTFEKSILSLFAGASVLYVIWAVDAIKNWFNQN
jgi:hypothetical protein